LDRRELLKGGICTMAVTGMMAGLPQSALAQMTGPMGVVIPPGPVARKVPVSITQHGQTRIDNYAWMRAANWQEVINEPTSLPADIRTHIEAENAYTQANLLDVTERLRESLFEELKGKLKQDDSSVPARDGAFAYATRFREGGQYPIVYRKAVDPATGEAHRC
jgi:oligopeptidase B